MVSKSNAFRALGLSKLSKVDNPVRSRPKRRRDGYGISREGSNEIVEQLWPGHPTIRFLADVGDDVFHVLASMPRSDVRWRWSCHSYHALWLQGSLHQCLRKAYSHPSHPARTSRVFSTPISKALTSLSKVTLRKMNNPASDPSHRRFNLCLLPLALVFGRYSDSFHVKFRADLAVIATLMDLFTYAFTRPPIFSTFTKVMADFTGVNLFRGCLNRRNCVDSKAFSYPDIDYYFFYKWCRLMFTTLGP